MTTTASSARSPLQNLALQVGVVLVVMSFQINVMFRGVPVVYTLFYATLLLCFVAVIRDRLTWGRLNLLLGIVFVAAALGSPFKGMGLAVGGWLGYLAVSDYRDRFERVLVWLFVVNFLVVVAQFFGLSERVYDFQFYANQAEPRSVFEAGFGIPAYLPQFRPSGIFPAVTYVSAFTVLLFASLVMSSRFNSKRVFFFMGVWFALLGSTVGLLLALASIVIVIKRRPVKHLVIGYVLTMVTYAVLLPLQFIYNFSMSDARVSLMARADLADAAGESVAQGNFPVFVVLCFVGAFAALTVRRLDTLITLIPFTAALMLPALVHDVSMSMFYWFLVGSAFAGLAIEMALNRAAESKTVRATSAAEAVPNPQ